MHPFWKNDTWVHQQWESDGVGITTGTKGSWILLKSQVHTHMHTSLEWIWFWSLQRECFLAEIAVFAVADLI